MKLQKAFTMTKHFEKEIPNFKYDNLAGRFEKKKLQQKYEKMEQLLEKAMPHLFVPDKT
jgi:hypothetical protein